MFEKDLQRDAFNQLIQFFHDKEFAKAERLLSERPNLRRHTDQSGRSAIHYAAASGHLEFVSNELTTSPDFINSSDDSGWTLLLIAASAGHTEIVRLLLSSQQCNVNSRNNTGQCALHYACSKDHLAIMQSLINAGADLNVQDERGATPLHRAASKGHKRIVNLLMGYRDRLQINIQDREGDTPLHLACEDEEIPTAILLVNCGADISRVNRKGNTPLDMLKDVQAKQKLREAARSCGS